MANEFNVGLNVQQINYFEKKIVKRMRVESLADQLASEGGDSALHRVTDLKNTTWGYKAIMTMVPDDTSYGTVGDNRLQDHEAGITAHDLEITFDQFRKAFKNEGVMADRSVWFKFAQQASDQLAFWAKDTKDRLMMNTLAGVTYDREVDGSTRGPACDWKNNRFANDVTPPSPNRNFRWDVDAGGDTTKNTLVNNGATGDVDPIDLPTWNMFVDMRSELPLMRIKPIRGKWGNGSDLYIAIVHPRTLNVLKKDPDFIANLRYSMPRGKENPVFKGAETYLIDGILVISHRYAYSTLGAADGDKWGGSGDVNGARTIFLGAQALGMVEIGNPKWVTRTDDFENQIAISMAYKFGFRKSIWPDQYAENKDEDFGVCVVNHAIPTGASGYTI